MLLDDWIEDGRPSDLHRAAPRTTDVAAPAKSPHGTLDPAGGLPPELAFLLAQGIAPGLVRRAARIAEELGVPGEDALFGLGFPDERYARLLARHLGAPYLYRPPVLAREGLDLVAAARVGWARLAPQAGRVAHVFAPRGDALRYLLEQHRFADVGTYGFAVTTRRRFEALLRRHDPALCERAASGLAGWDATLSARGGATRAQSVSALGVVAVLVLSFAVAPGATTITVSAILFAIFAAALALRLTVVAASGPRKPAPPSAALADRDLPVYTLIIPLFREARVLPGLVRALDALDYPAAKLDLKIMLEQGDHDTAAAAARLGLPPRYDVIVLPDGHPRTKPRALNAALEAARGDVVVVYDAEDRPHPGQLRAAAARFAADPGLACLQARLTIDHADETWITRLFALDYAALFHGATPGLAALGLPVALGGTSNHFRASVLRRVNGWDAWNVTEDIDLGYRLARFGFRVGALDADTFEEAPLTLARWMPQRSRWLKGWMITLIVHGRRPRRLFGELGLRAGLTVAISLSATVLSCLLGPPLLLAVAVEAWCGTLFRAETPLWWLFVAASAALLAGGSVAALWPALLGLRRMGRLDLAGWLLALPIYLLLVSAAAWRALFELWRDPQAWNKTEHGLARKRPRARRVSGQGG